MKVRYRLVRFVKDPFRGDERLYVAVVVFSPVSTVLRAVGLGGEGKVDLAPFVRLSRVPESEAWAYGEWVYWFQGLLDPGEGEPAPDIDKTLDRLAERGESFTAGPSLFAVAPDQDFEGLADRLFNEHVVRESDSG